MMRRGFLVAALLVPFVGAVSEAQGRGGLRNRPEVLRPGRRPDPELQQQAPAARRLLLEQQVRRGFWRVAKNRIGFSDEQMLRLEQTSQRFDQRRRQLAQQERTSRVAMRTEILADSTANQAALGSALDQLIQLQRQRVELNEEEQKEFASFMTPVQRAKLFALQEQLRKRIQDLVKARPDSAATGLPQSPQ